MRFSRCNCVNAKTFKPSLQRLGTSNAKIKIVLKLEITLLKRKMQLLLGNLSKNFQDSKKERFEHLNRKLKRS